MSAEDLGMRLLGEIQSEGLDELLSSLRLLHDPSSLLRLGVPPLDALLEVFAGPPPPQQVRPASRPVFSDVADYNEAHSAPARVVPVKPKAPPIIELTSPGTNDGKSQFLYYLTAISVLPEKINDIHIGGQDAAVVFLDTETRFNISRLVQIMNHHINLQIATYNQAASTTDPTGAASTPPSPKEVKTIVQECLKHIHIYRPQSLASLTTTILSLPTYLFNPTTHYSSQKRLSLILLDSASSFQHQDKAELEALLLPTSSPTSPNPSDPRPQSGYIHLASALRKTSAGLKAAVVYTTTSSSFPPPKANLSTERGTGAVESRSHLQNLRPQLPTPWPNLPLLRLVISRRAVRRFPMGMTAEEVVVQRARREAAVRRGVFDVGVNGFGEESWGTRVSEGVRRWGGFEVGITRDGIVVVAED